MAKWKGRDTVILAAGLGVLGWIIWKNWFRKGSTAVESVDSGVLTYDPSTGAPVPQIKTVQPVIGPPD